MKRLDFNHSVIQLSLPHFPHVMASVATLNEKFSSIKSRRLAQSRAARALLESSMYAHGAHAHTTSYRITKSREGKPRLVSDFNDAPPHISLSHSQEWVACAWSKEAIVGVDIEVLRTKFAEGVSALFLHTSELTWLDTLSNQARDIETLRLWCLKEALFKAATAQSDWQFNEIAFSDKYTLVAAPRSLLPISSWHFHSEVLTNTNTMVAVAWQQAFSGE